MSVHLHPGDIVSQPAESPDACAARLRVLADPTRLAVVGQLLAGPQHVSALIEALGLEQSLLSHHLKVLRDADLVLAERDGKSVLYRLAPDVAGGRDATTINIGCCAIVFKEATP
jgi:ArsR family transcriptional regulator, nickel/cobalt-responsive transcriptional repressor